MIPDLVAQALSPPDRLRQAADKIGECLESGIPLAWLVDPEQKCVTAYRSLTDICRHSVDDVLTAEPVLPGFSCRVSEFFE